MYCVFVVPLIPDPSIAFTLTSNHDDLYLSHNCPLQYKSKRLSAYYAKYFTGYSQQKTRLTSACNSMAYELGISQENEEKGKTWLCSSRSCGWSDRWIPFHHLSYQSHYPHPIHYHHCCHIICTVQLLMAVFLTTCSEADMFV